MLRSPESLSLLITTVSASMLLIAVVTSEATPLAGAVFGPQALDVSVGVSLVAVQDAKRVLPSMPVETSKGELLGEVRSVHVGRDGTPKSVTIATRGFFGLSTITATLKAEDLVYLRDRGTLVSRLTQTEIAAQADRMKARRSL